MQRAMHTTASTIASWLFCFHCASVLKKPASRPSSFSARALTRLTVKSSALPDWCIVMTTSRSLREMASSDGMPASESDMVICSAQVEVATTKNDRRQTRRGVLKWRSRPWLGRNQAGSAHVTVGHPIASTGATIKPRNLEYSQRTKAEVYLHFSLIHTRKSAYFS